MSTALPRQKVELAHTKLDLNLRRRCDRWFRKTITVEENGQKVVKGIDSPDGNWYRYGSDNYSKKCPELGVTDDQRALMYECHEAGMSFREIEETFHLSPQSGNDAQRCCRQHAALIQQGLVSKSARSAKLKSDLSRSQVVRVVQTYMKRKPKRANAVFKEIELLMPHPEPSTKPVAV